MSVVRVHSLAALVAVLAFPLVAQAQSAPPAAPAPAGSAAPRAGHHHHRHHSLWHDLKGLNLTAAQQQQATAYHDAMQKANATADRATKEANGAKLHTQLMGILTPAQKAQLASMHHSSEATPGAAPMATPAPH